MHPTIRCTFTPFKFFVESQDIKSWFLKRASSLTIEGATTADLQRLEKTIDIELPSSLKFMLLESNGGLWYMEKEFMSCSSIAQVIGKFEGRKSWRSGVVPLCGDEGMGMLVVDTTTAKVAVYEWDEDDGIAVDPLFPSLASFLEGYRNLLLAGQCEFLDECGVVEKVSKSRK